MVWCDVLDQDPCRCQAAAFAHANLYRLGQVEPGVLNHPNSVLSVLVIARGPVVHYFHNVLAMRAQKCAFQPETGLFVKLT